METDLIWSILFHFTFGRTCVVFIVQRSHLCLPHTNCTYSTFIIIISSLCNQWRLCVSLSFCNYIPHTTSCSRMNPHCPAKRVSRGKAEWERHLSLSNEFCLSLSPVCVSNCVCVYVCVREREREKGRARQNGVLLWQLDQTNTHNAIYNHPHPPFQVHTVYKVQTFDHRIVTRVLFISSGRNPNSMFCCFNEWMYLAL